MERITSSPQRHALSEISQSRVYGTFASPYCRRPKICDHRDPDIKSFLWQFVLKKSLNASNPSEHPPGREGNISVEVKLYNPKGPMLVFLWGYHK